MDFVSCICGGIVEIPASLIVLSTLGVVGAADVEKWPREKLEEFVQSKSRVFLAIICGFWVMVAAVVAGIGLVSFETWEEGFDVVNLILGILFVALLAPLVYYARSLTRKRKELLEALRPSQ